MSEIDRNASSSANGWLFQVSAGVYLFFEDLKNNKSLKIEGEKQDVEIATVHGKRYAQVKSIENINNRNTVSEHYNSALDSLKDADDSQTELIYFSNIQNPFNTKDDKFYDFGTSFGFYDLDEKAQNKIRKKLGDNFSYDKLSIKIVHFYGTNDSKKKFVIDKINSFLSSIGRGIEKTEIIYDSMITKAFFNSTDRKVTIKKAEFVCYILLPYFQENLGIDEFKKVMSEEYYEDCVELYSKLLQKNELNYELMLKITTDFTSIKQERRVNLYEYINEEYKKYLYLTPDAIDEDLREGAVKIFLFRVIQRKQLISAIKKEAGL